jgi:nudix-type nucleoside diphosphatase (YffH/AdpP family)
MLEVAAEVMSVYDHQTEDNMPLRMGAIRERSESRIRAKNIEKESLVKRNYSRVDVAVAELTRPYAKFFAVEDYDLSHRNFDGGWSNTMTRAAFATADAVTVLPYDPVLDKVVLIEQFRVGAYSRGDQHPWLLEVVAGRCDSGQTPEQVARREAQEEAGLTVDRMELIAEYYTSPGAYNEYIYSYIGRADLADYREGIHGLGSENEDIATHLLDRADLLALIASGEANNTPLIISIQWLELNWDRLQKEWTDA